MIDRIKLELGWRKTCKWLREAEAMIRQECDEKTIAHWLGEFENFIEHNELECALNMLEEACDHFTPSPAVWSLMGEAASSMKLSESAESFRKKAQLPNIAAISS